MAATTTVSATKLVDSTGALVVNARITFLPVTNDGLNIPYLIGGGGGLASKSAVPATVLNGVFRIDLPDTSQTIPKHVGFKVVVRDIPSGRILIDEGYECFQPAGSSVAFDTVPPNLAAQITVQMGPSGPAGDVSFDTLSSALAQVTGIAAIKVSPPINIFDDTQMVAGSALHIDGSVGALSGFTFLGLMKLPAGAESFRCNGKVGFFVPPDGSLAYGVVYYDENKSVVASESANVASGSSGNNDASANTVHHIPSGLAPGYVGLYCQDSIQPVPYSQMMVVVSTTSADPVMPGSYVSSDPVITGGPGSNPIVRLDTMNAAIAAASLTGGAVSGPVNLLDPSAITANSAIRYEGGPPFQVVPAFVSANGYNRTALLPVSGKNSVASNVALHCNNGYGPAWADSNGNLLVPTGDLLALIQAGNNIPAGHSIQVQAGAASFVCYANVSGSGSGDGGPQDISQWMICTSTTSTVTFPSSFLPFGVSGGTSTPNATDTTARTAAAAAQTTANTALAAALPMSGGKVILIGDSISTYIPSGVGTQWQHIAAAALGLTITLDSRWAGRQLFHAFDNSGDGGSPAPSQSLVLAADYLWLFLGTNINSATGVPSASEIGTAADAPDITNGASFCANLRAVLEQLITWNPKLRIIWISPYQSARYNAAPGFGHGVLPDAGSLTAMKGIATNGMAVCNLYGVPYVDLYNTSQFCNLTNAAYTVDQLHPTGWAVQNILAPAIARKTIQFSKV